MLLKLLMCLSGLSTSADGQESAGKRTIIAAGGVPAAAVVIPADAPHPVRFAADELKFFLDQMTDGDFRIVSRIPRKGVAIVLGEPLAKEAGIDVSGITRDGYRIKTVGPRIYIAGRDDHTEKSNVLFSVKDGPLPTKATGLERARAWGDVAWDFERGTLHGVYDFLERLGVRWFFAGPKGTVVPQRKDLSLAPVNVTEEPHFRLRINHGIMFPNPSYIRKGVFNLDEYRRLGWNGRNQRLWMVRQRTSSRFMAFNHRPRRHQWSKRFAEKHPEYFALMKDGTRAVGHNRKREYLNYTSEGVFRETVLDIEAFYSGKPSTARGIELHSKFASTRGWWPQASYGDTFSLLPNDGLSVDTSEASRKFLHEDLPFPHRHADYIWQFVERVARAVEPRFPGKYLTCIAYQTYWEVPSTVRALPDNVIVGIAALSGASRMSTSVNKARYRAHLDLIERWSKMNNTPMLFWNYSLYRHNQRSREGVPMLLPRHAGKVFKDLSRFGRWVFMQNDFDNIIFEHINRYVYSRLMWNPGAKVEHILDDYAMSFYGPAAKVMKAMLDDIESRCTKIAAADADSIAVWESYFTGEALNRYREAISKAERLTKNTPYAEAIRLMSDRFIGVMERQRENYVRDVKKLRDEGADILKVRSVRGKPITIDGMLSEREWLRTGGRSMKNNVDGRPTELNAKLRARFNRDKFLCCFDIRSPGAKERLAGDQRKDYIEVFLDTNNDRTTYYWIMVNMAGKVTTRLYPGPGEPPDVNWESKVESSVKVGEDGWLVEMAIPLSTLQAEIVPGKKPAWGGNFCLTRFKAHGTNDMFSSINPLLRGSFHKPGLFARIIFEP